MNGNSAYTGRTVNSIFKMAMKHVLPLLLLIFLAGCKEKADINRLYNDSPNKLELEFKFANVDGKEYASFGDGHSYKVTYDKIKNQLYIFSSRVADLEINEIYHLRMNKFHCTNTQICFDRHDREGGERIVIENAGDYYIAHVFKLHRHGHTQSEWKPYITFYNTSERNHESIQTDETEVLKQVFTIVSATSDDGVVNIREQPSNKAKVLGELNAAFDGLGEGVLIEKGDEWSKVRIKDVVGYVYTKYVGFTTWYDGSGNSILVANHPQTPIYENAEVENGPIKFSVVEKGTILGDRYEDFDEYYALPTAGSFLLVRKEDCKTVTK